MVTKSRAPFVYWSQDKDHIFLRVEVLDSKNAKASVDNKIINFSAVSGNGQNYEFSLNLSQDVEKSLKLCENAANVELTLTKKSRGEGNTEWASLIDRTKTGGRLPPWLKFDFDRWHPDEDSEEDSEFVANPEKMADNAYDQLLSGLSNEQRAKIMTREELMKRINMMHSTYLVAYNVGMFVAHFYVLALLIYGYFIQRSEDFLATFWERRFASFVSCTLLQYMDVLHSAAGITKSSWKTAFLQITGRLAMLSVVNYNPEIYGWPPVFGLVLTYFIGEQFRYPYYALKSMSVSLSVITWLRYNHFLVFYPTGFFLEALILLRSVPYYYTSGTLSLQLPNILNISFNMGILLGVFSLTVFPYAAISLFVHMKKQRAKKNDDGISKKKSL